MLDDKLRVIHSYQWQQQIQNTGDFDKCLAQELQATPCNLRNFTIKISDRQKKVEEKEIVKYR